MKVHQLIHSILENTPTTGKIADYKPGQSASIETSPGMTTTIDLKKNPTALAKDATGKLTLVTKPQTPGQQQPQQGPDIKPGADIEIAAEDSDNANQEPEYVIQLKRLAGL